MYLYYQLKPPQPESLFLTLWGVESHFKYFFTYIFCTELATFHHLENHHFSSHLFAYRN